MKPYYRSKSKTSSMPILLFVGIVLIILFWKLVPAILLIIFVLLFIEALQKK